jgi:hypothetical protein
MGKTPEQIAEGLVAMEVLHKDNGRCNDRWPYAFGRKESGYAQQYFKSAEQAINDGNVALTAIEYVRAALGGNFSLEYDSWQGKQETTIIDLRPSRPDEPSYTIWSGGAAAICEACVMAWRARDD